MGSEKETLYHGWYKVGMPRKDCFRVSVLKLNLRLSLHIHAFNRFFPFQKVILKLDKALKAEIDFKERLKF